MRSVYSLIRTNGIGRLPAAASGSPGGVPTLLL
jgi:hypothetical protein